MARVARENFMARCVYGGCWYGWCYAGVVMEAIEECGVWEMDWVKCGEVREEKKDRCSCSYMCMS